MRRSPAAVRALELHSSNVRNEQPLFVRLVRIASPRFNSPSALLFVVQARRHAMPNLFSRNEWIVAASCRAQRAYFELQLRDTKAMSLTLLERSGDLLK